MKCLMCGHLMFHRNHLRNEKGDYLGLGCALCRLEIVKNREYIFSRNDVFALLAKDGSFSFGYCEREEGHVESYYPLEVVEEL